MLSSDTIQFIARVFTLTVAAAVLAIVMGDLVSIFYFGDGEGIAIIAQLNGPLIAALGSLGLGAVGHQALTVLLGRMLPSSVPVVQPSPSNGVMKPAAQESGT